MILVIALSLNGNFISVTYVLSQIHAKLLSLLFGLFHATLQLLRVLHRLNQVGQCARGAKHVARPYNVLLISLRRQRLIMSGIVVLFLLRLLDQNRVRIVSLRA